MTMDQAEVNRWTLAAELLEQLLEQPLERRPDLARQLGSTNGVRLELEQLLAGTQSGSLLDESLDSVLREMPDTAPAVNEFRGRQIGPWLLEEEIGRGGMSVVYHAERTGQGFKQHAALKILSVGYLGEDFVAGFLRERQILSDLQHPGIARLIDGGITPDGAPYLVMQYVKGERIDRWCQRVQAGVRDIAGLMVSLCEAVAYQQKHLVVHQDINPSNVLVDEHGQPIVIDFGIATLLDSASSGQALRLFTPRYAAPEQRTGRAITTATDVYALGRMLRVLTSGKRIDDDLQRVLDMATREDPEARYANARQLGTDLQAWLERRPVQARPQTLGYRASRYISRNRWGVAAAAVVMLSLVGGLAAATWQAQIAAAERDTARIESARANEVTKFLKNLFLASDPDRSRGEQVSARNLLDQGAHQARTAFETAPDLKAEMLVLVGSLYHELDELEAAESILLEALPLAESEDAQEHLVDALRALALVRMEIGDHESALQLTERAEQLLADAQRIPGRQHSGLMRSLLFSLAELGRANEAADRGLDAVALARAAQGLEDSALFAYLFNTANVLMIAERAGEAEPLLLEAAEIELSSEGNPTNRMDVHSNLAGIYGRKGELERALEHRREALLLAETIFPPGHSRRARALSNLASTLMGLSRLEEAEAALLEALDIYRVIYGDAAHPRVAAAHNNMGMMFRRAGRYREAVPHLQAAREMAADLLGRDDHRYAAATGNLGDVYRRLGQWDLAEPLLLERFELDQANLGPGHPLLGNGMALLAALRLDQQRYAEALEWTDQALALFEQAGYEHPVSLIVTTSRRARALTGLGRQQEARQMLDFATGVAAKAGDNAADGLAELDMAREDFTLVTGGSTPGQATP
jgi:serine/threonine-protein kinase